MLQFEPSTHTYTKDGLSVLNVTTILALEGCYKGADYFTEEKRTIGDYVHKATALLDKYELDEYSLDSVLRGYTESWKRFIELTGFIPEFIERPMYSPTYSFAGTPDRTGRFNKPPQRVGVPHRVCIDIKCGLCEQPADTLQTAAYELLCQENDIPIDMRGTCYLDPSGGIPKWHPHKEYSDRDVFLSMLTSVRWKQKRGLI